MSSERSGDGAGGDDAASRPPPSSAPAAPRADPPAEPSADPPAGDPGEPPAGPPGQDLGPRERAVLELERRSWPGPGAKERAIRERLGISPTRYYQLLNALQDDPRALAHDPVTVNRLRRLREARRKARRDSRTR